MEQNKIKINDVVIFQPDADMAWNFETTYTNDSVRVRSGRGNWTPMFTVESYTYTASNVPVDKATELLQMIVGRIFNMYRFSPYYGTWRTDEFQVGKGSLKIGTLKADEEIYSSLSFNIVGVNPL